MYGHDLVNVECACCTVVCYRRTQAGYWSDDEAIDRPAGCIAPSTDRCVGWSSALGSSVCGTGYDQASPGCKSCADGYYPEIQVCTACPVGGNAYAKVAVFLLVVVIAFVSAFAVIVLVTRKHGGNFGNGIFR